MTAVWGEINTDAQWDPWLLRQIRATLEGHTNGEAVAIRANTINDPDQFAAAWRNLGGGGAGAWHAADGDEIAAAPDSGWRFSKTFTAVGGSFSGPIQGTTATFSGQVHAGSLVVDGTTALGGHLTASTGSFSGAVTANGITTTTLGATGNVTLGDAAADTLSVAATSNFFAPLSVRNGPGTSFPLYADPTNNRTIIGGATPLSGDTTPALHVLGRAYIAPDGSGNDQALVVRHNASSGSFSLGATNSATPDLILKNAGGTQVGRVTTGGVFLGGAQTAAVAAAGAGDVQARDLFVTDGANWRRIDANGTALQISANANGAATDLTLDSLGVLTTHGLVADSLGVDAGPMTSTPAANVGYAPAFAKGWTYFDPTSVSGHTSYNVASISDSGAGNWSVNWDRDFGSSSYAVVATAAGAWDSGVGSLRLCQEHHSGRSAGATQILCARPDTAALSDPQRMSVVAFGRQ